MEEYKEVGKATFIDVFNIELGKKILEFNKLHKPFDIVCARLEFRDSLEQAEKESERVYGYVKENIKVDISLGKYGDESRFELVEDKEETEFIIVNGIRTSTISGHTLSYKCKIRNHGISVFIPIKEYNEMKVEVKKTK